MAEKGTTKPRLLVVPHVYAEDIRVREVELARRLKQDFDVFCMTWADVLNVDSPHVLLRRLKQVQRGLGTLLTRKSVEQHADGVMRLRMPILQPAFFRWVLGEKKALQVSLSWNRRLLAQVIREMEFTHVLIASGNFYLPKNTGARIFYDQVDWFAEERSAPWKVRFSREHVKQLGEVAELIFTVSDPLTEKLQEDLYLKSITLANGADVNALRGVSAAEVEVVRERWRLMGKFVIGYIGNHAAFSGVDFLMKAFEGVRRCIPNAVLFIVGPAHYWISKISALVRDDTIFTGTVSPNEMPAYFNAIDIGVLAQDLSLETQLAFQLKVVEYTACRKFVVSTPLETWKRLRWPNVVFADRDVNAWVSAISGLKDAKWDPAWDALVEEYDWDRLASRAARIMLDPPDLRPHP